MDPRIDLNLKGTESNERVEGIFAKYVRILTKQDLEKKHNDGYTIFTFIRDPFARIRSLYKEKICEYLFSHFKSMGMKQNMHFRDFVKIIARIPDSNSNDHYKSQHSFLYQNSSKGSNIMPFIKVGLLENFDEDLKRIFGKHYRDSFKKFHYRKTNSTTLTIDPDTHRLLEARYREDVNMYNKVVSNLKENGSIRVREIEVKNSNLNPSILRIQDTSIIERSLEKIEITPDFKKKFIKKNHQALFRGLDQNLLEDLVLVCKNIMKESKRDKRTIIMTFSDYGYRNITMEFYQHLKNLNIDNYVVIATEEKMFKFLKDKEINTHMIPKSFRKGPAIPAHQSNFWIYRMTVIQYVLSKGLNILHSDADAFWKKDPKELFDSDSDIIISQGTFMPWETHEKWKFVMCCGLMYFKSTPQVRSVISRCISHMGKTLDDQISLNVILIGTQWDKTDDNEPIQHTHNGRIIMEIYNKPLTGINKDFGMSFKVTLIPFKDVQRIEITKSAFIYHLIANKNIK
jgi:hypothetical protein